MKKNIFLLLVAILTIASCKTKEKIIYFQDITPDSVATTVIPTQQSVLKLVPGDKIGITVTSAATCRQVRHIRAPQMPTTCVTR